MEIFATGTTGVLNPIIKIVHVDEVSMQFYSNNS